MQAYKKLPSVLIQDPRKDHAYLISADELKKYEMSAEKLVYVDQGVITFSIPEDEYIEVTPAFNAEGSETPSVIIQFEAGQKSYFMTYSDLQTYLVDQPSEYGGYGISFVIPAGNEFLEDLSPVQYASLQSGEGGGGGWSAKTNMPAATEVTTKRLYG